MILRLTAEIIIVSTGFMGLNHTISQHIASQSWSIKLVEIENTITMVLIATSFWLIYQKFNFGRLYILISSALVLCLSLVDWFPQIDSFSGNIHLLSDWLFILLMLFWTILFIIQEHEKLTRIINSSVALFI
jgi:thiosulfate reductase cytochrome b subunit